MYDEISLKIIIHESFAITLLHYFYLLNNLSIEN